MLSACKAIVIGRTDAQTRWLTTVAQKVGFALIESAATGDIPAPRTLITFVMVHYAAGDEVLAQVIAAIRSGGKDVRFSPVVVLADDCDFETVLRFVHMGVDDVISLPEKRDVLEQRLASQLWSEQVYVETADYFGPDRRRLEGPSHEDERRAGSAGHARYSIQRIPDIGTRIVKHQVFPAAHFTPTIHY